VNGISEIETGSGDTGFVVFLKASQGELTENGQYIAKRFKTRDAKGTTWHTMHDIALALGGSEGGYEATVVVDHGTPETLSPRLIIEGTAGAFLDNLSKLSEASYYCLDSATKTKAEKVIARRKKTPDDSNFAAPTSLQAYLDDFDDEVVFFMFCMRPEDLDVTTREIDTCMDDVCCRDDVGTE